MIKMNLIRSKVPRKHLCLLRVREKSKLYFRHISYFFCFEIGIDFYEKAELLFCEV